MSNMVSVNVPSDLDKGAALFGNREHQMMWLHTELMKISSAHSLRLSSPLGVHIAQLDAIRLITLFRISLKEYSAFLERRPLGYYSAIFEYTVGFWSTNQIPNNERADAIEAWSLKANALYLLDKKRSSRSGKTPPFLKAVPSVSVMVRSAVQYI